MGISFPAALVLDTTIKLNFMSQEAPSQDSTADDKPSGFIVSSSMYLPMYLVTMQASSDDYTNYVESFYK